MSQNTLMSPVPGDLNTQETTPTPKETVDRINVGYDGGFVLTGPLGKVGKDSPQFQMKIGTWGQLRHNYFDSNGPNADQNEFEFERLRLTFNGFAWNPNFRYSFQFDADTDAGPGAEVVDALDYFVTLDIGNQYFGMPQKQLALRFGKWKIGFNRAREESGTRMQFSDRATASVLFDFDRSIGFGLLGELTPRYGESLDWQLTIGNGIDTGGFRTNRVGQLDRNMSIASRINWLMMGDWGKDGHADLDHRCIPAIRLGGGFAFTRIDRDGTREFNFPRVVDTGASINTVLPGAVDAYNLFLFSQDINVKYLGWSLIFESYYRQFSGFTGAALPSFNDFGYWFEVGKFVIPGRMQLIARHSYIEGDSSTLGGINTSSDEVAGGLVWYFNKHQSKMTFDVTRLNGSPANDSALGIRAGDSGYLFRTTYQWKF